MWWAGGGRGKPPCGDFVGRIRGLCPTCPCHCSAPRFTLPCPFLIIIIIIFVCVPCGCGPAGDTRKPLSVFDEQVSGSTVSPVPVSLTQQLPSSLSCHVLALSCLGSWPSVPSLFSLLKCRTSLAIPCLMLETSRPLGWPQFLLHSQHVLHNLSAALSPPSPPRPTCLMLNSCLLLPKFLSVLEHGPFGFLTLCEPLCEHCSSSCLPRPQPHLTYLPSVWPTLPPVHMAAWKSRTPGSISWLQVWVRCPSWMAPSSCVCFPCPSTGPLVVCLPIYSALSLRCHGLSSPVGALGTSFCGISFSTFLCLVGDLSAEAKGS